MAEKVQPGSTMYMPNKAPEGFVSVSIRLPEEDYRKFTQKYGKTGDIIPRLIKILIGEGKPLHKEKE